MRCPTLSPCHAFTLRSICFSRAQSRRVGHEFLTSPLTIHFLLALLLRSAYGAPNPLYAHHMTPTSDTDFLPPKTLPVVNDLSLASVSDLTVQMREAYRSWLAKSPSRDTRSNYDRDVRQFMMFTENDPKTLESLATVRPHHVAAWRDHLRDRALTNASIRRKMTALRSLFSYLQSYGFVGANPAHSDFVDAPAVARDGKTIALSPQDCRSILDAPAAETPAGIRDRALFAVLAYAGCRVGELTRLRVGSCKQNGVHRVLEVHGKGGKERLVPLHAEAAERIEVWLDVAGIRDDLKGPLFRPVKTGRGNGVDGFINKLLSRRAVQKLVATYVKRLVLDPNVTVHSFRATALTTARENGSDIIDLQDYAGHADPRTTLAYIRTRDRLSKSPAYVLRY
jgi:integrase/recombinase XerD